MTRSELKLFLVEAELRKLLCKVYFSHDGFDSGYRYNGLVFLV